MRSKLSSLGLILNTTRPEAATVGREVVEVCRRTGIKLTVETRSARILGLPGKPLNQTVRRSEGIAVAGGDGTLLACVPSAAEFGRPVLGINMGSLGFLTSRPRAETRQVVADFIEGRWIPQPRTLLRVTLRSGRTTHDLGLALNEAVVSRTERALLVRFTVWVAGELVTHYSADGLIVATPTGSTAYSLSANGAVLTPDAPVLSLTPVCPHTLTNRPVIVSDRARIRIRPDPGQHLKVTLDGHREASVPDGTELELSLATERLTLVTFSDYSFFEVLRTKLNWSGSNVGKSL
jgi:NAD+ kinase